MSAFWRLYSGLDREGPGSAADVHWALAQAGTGPRARVCDAGCGSGADAVTLAGALPEARITGIEKAAHLAAEARSRTARFGPRVEIRQADMSSPGGPYDLIWCAGALYFLGVTEGLAAWRAALAPGGCVAFSEPCAVSTPPSAAAAAFWTGYPALTDLAGISARVEAAGYEVLGHRMVVGDAWAGYYASLSRRIARLRPEADADLTGVLDAAEAEIGQWRAAPDQIAYALMLVRPS